MLIKVGKFSSHFYFVIISLVVFIGKWPSREVFKVEYGVANLIGLHFVE